MFFGQEEMIKTIGLFLATCVVCINCAQASCFEFAGEVANFSKDRLRPIKEEVASYFACEILGVPPEELTVRSLHDVEHDIKSRIPGAQIFGIKTPAGKEFIVKSSTNHTELLTAITAQERTRGFTVPGVTFIFPSHVAVIRADGRISRPLQLLESPTAMDHYRMQEAQQPFRFLQFMEKAGGFDLVTLCKKHENGDFSDADILATTDLIGKVVGAINRGGFQHGDLHGGNILIDLPSREVFLIDFSTDMFRVLDVNLMANAMCVPLRGPGVDSHVAAIWYCSLFCFLNSYYTETVEYGLQNMELLLQRNYFNGIDIILQNGLLFPQVDTEGTHKYFATIEEWTKIQDDDLHPQPNKMVRTVADYLIAEHIRSTFNIRNLKPRHLLIILGFVFEALDEIGNRCGEYDGRDCTRHVDDFAHSLMGLRTDEQFSEVFLPLAEAGE
jgi:hypothetical protein